MYFGNGLSLKNRKRFLIVLCIKLIRPSGTEPKIKFYFGVKEETFEGSVKVLEEIQRDFLGRVGEGGIVRLLVYFPKVSWTTITIYTDILIKLILNAY